MTLAAAAVHPALGIVAETVQQIQHGIRPRRGADRSRAACRRRSRDRRWRPRSGSVTRDRAARHARRRKPRFRPRHDEHRLEAAEATSAPAVRRVVDRRAVDDERVGVVVRRERLGRHAPHALLVLLHRQRLPADRRPPPLCAFGARSRNVTRRSAPTSGDFTGGAPRPPCAGAAAVAGGVCGAGACRAVTREDAASAAASVTQVRWVRFISR